MGSKRAVNLSKRMRVNPLLGNHKGDAGQHGPTGLIVGKNGSAVATADPFAESSTQLFEFGTILKYGERTFRYAGVGGSGITAGLCVQSAAAVANHRDMAVQAAAVAGATSISVTLGSTAATLDQYAEGYLLINDAAGEGQLLRVKNHAAADSAATLTVNVYDKLVTALTTSSKADLVAATYNDLVVAPTTHTGPVVGITPMDFTADYFGWIQCGGPVAALTSGTLLLGGNAVRSDTTAGAVEPADEDVEAETIVVGQVMVLNGNTDYSLIWLNLE